MSAQPTYPPPASYPGASYPPQAYPPPTGAGAGAPGGAGGYSQGPGPAGYGGPGPNPAGPSPADMARARFQQFVDDREINPSTADDLYGVLTTSKVALLLDDSGSMKTRVIDDGASAFVAAGAPVITRWSELEKLAAFLVDMVTATTPEGVDVHFLNRGSVTGVTAAPQLAPLFATGPAGGTPLIGALRRIFDQNLPIAQSGKRVIVVVITDGEPSDGSADDLFRLLSGQRHDNFHLSIAECNDNEEEMAYLDGWDRRLKNFDNTDDYKMELSRVRAVQGPKARFTYVDYAVKIVLGSTVRKYFQIDQAGAGGGFGGGTATYTQNSYPSGGQYNNNNNQSGGCCSIL